MTFCYEPGHDTYFLMKILRELNYDEVKNQTICEIGTGSGEIIKIFDKSNRILVTDVNLACLRNLTERIGNYHVDLRVNGDLFGLIDSRSIDLVIFNTPYDESSDFDEIPCENEQKNRNSDENEKITRFGTYSCQCYNCLMVYALKNTKTIQRFLNTVRSKEFVILISKKNQIELPANYQIEEVGRWKGMGETLIVIRGVRK